MVFIMVDFHQIGSASKLATLSLKKESSPYENLRSKKKLETKKRLGEKG